MYLCYFVLASVAGAQDVRFTQPGETVVEASEGYVLLGWEPAATNAVEGMRFELQQSTAEDFADPVVRYRGPERTTYISGLPAGAFHYRVRALTSDSAHGPWSSTVSVNVNYVSYRIVVVLCAAGLVVLVAVLTAVIGGHRRYAERES